MCVCRRVQWFSSVSGTEGCPGTEGRPDVCRRTPRLRQKLPVRAPLRYILTHDGMSLLAKFLVGSINTPLFTHWIYTRLVFLVFHCMQCQLTFFILHFVSVRFLLCEEQSLWTTSGWCVKVWWIVRCRPGEGGGGPSHSPSSLSCPSSLSGSRWVATSPSLGVYVTAYTMGKKEGKRLKNGSSSVLQGQQPLVLSL